MSLSLLQGYSSAEDEEGKQQDSDSTSSSLAGEDGSDRSDSDSDRRKDRSGRSDPADPSDSAPGSLLPSAFEAFAEVAGPPEFLNNYVSGAGGRESGAAEVARRGWRREKTERKDLPAGVVVEAKAQLVGIRDRVRSDIEGSASANVTSGEGKRVISAANPESKDAAELLRMCLQCKVPKTYSHNQGVVCPICRDRPPDPLKELEKKKGSTVKDKEKSKRMKGQSSHATWKSETEMHLRQQYD